MNRNQLVKIHLYLSSFFLPFLFLFSVTGGLYLLGFKGTETKTEVFRTEGTLLSTKESVNSYLEKANIKFKYEYLKSNKNSHILRPSNRTHYLVEQFENEVVINKLEPSGQKLFMEMHKGHGPSFFKTFSIIWALGLILITLTGILIGWKVKSYRKPMLISSGLSIVLLVLLGFVI